MMPPSNLIFKIITHPEEHGEGLSPDKADCNMKSHSRKVTNFRQSMKVMVGVGLQPRN
jgi:hypothetical protein